MDKILKRANVISTFVELNIKVKTRVPSRQVGNWLADRFQHLGPTYIKIGQFISSRSDIFGEEFTEEFVNLRDQVKPIPPNQVKHIIQDINKKHDYVSSIDEVPLASASIGQVHKGIDFRGNPILVKVKRPQVKEMIVGDIEFLRSLFVFASRIQVENINNTITLLDEFEAFLSQEVNFHNEYDNLVKFYSLYMPLYGKTLLSVPRIIKSGCDNDVIMMEYIHNKGLDNFQGDRALLAKDIMRFFIRQLVQFGVLHGDPHKGNIGITVENKVVLYDYGNMITITDDERNLLKELIYMLVIGNKYGIVKILEQLGVEIVDKDVVAVYIERYIEYMRTLDVKVFMGLVKENEKLPIHLSGKIIRILRVYGILEGICKELDPTFNYFTLLDEGSIDLVFDAKFIDYKVKKDLGLMSKFQDMIYKIIE